MLDDEVTRDSDLADVDEKDADVTVESFFSSAEESLFTLVDFLLPILFLGAFSDQSFFASTAESIKIENI